MTLCSKGCGRPVKIRGYCNGCYQAKRTKWIRSGIWQRPAPAVGATRRVQALVALGWPQSELCRRTGISRGAMSHIARGNVDATSRENAKLINALYESLSMTPGPSVQARRHAQDRGWVPPLAWDDDTIDDPAAQPETAEAKRLKRHEEYLELRELGFTDREILHRWRIDPQSLLRMLSRAGIPQSAELQAMMRDRAHGIAS